MSVVLLNCNPLHVHASPACLVETEEPYHNNILLDVQHSQAIYTKFKLLKLLNHFPKVKVFFFHFGLASYCMMRIENNTYYSGSLLNYSKLGKNTMSLCMMSVINNLCLSQKFQLAKI